MASVCRLRGLLVVPACQEVCEARGVRKMDRGILFTGAARHLIEEKIWLAVMFEEMQVSKEYGAG